MIGRAPRDRGLDLADHVHVVAGLAARRREHGLGPAGPDQREQRVDGRERLPAPAAASPAVDRDALAHALGADAQGEVARQPRRLGLRPPRDGR